MKENMGKKSRATVPLSRNQDQVGTWDEKRTEVKMSIQVYL
jgi:hypothetical protein